MEGVLMVLVTDFSNKNYKPLPMSFNSLSELPTIRLTCSKYKPIEHQFFPFISRFWKGVKLTSIDFAQKLVEQRKEWVEKVQIFSYKIKKQYQKGIQVAKDFLEAVLKPMVVF